MTTWMHRAVLMDVSFPNEPCYQVHEIYYRDDGKVDDWTAKPIDITADSIEEIRDLLRQILEDIEFSFLKESELPGVKK